MGEVCNIKFLGREAGHPVSENLFGIFFEDINFSCDGGLNANLVDNYSFDGVFFSNEELKTVEDPLRYWIVEGGSLVSGCEGALHTNSKYGRVQADGKAALINLGFNGRKAHKDECAMSILTGSTYIFESCVRVIDYEGTVTVGITDAEGKKLTGEAVLELPENGEWTQLCTEVSGLEEGYGKLVITFEGKGTIDLDCVSFMDYDYWNAGDAKWTNGKFRKDLIQALADLKPAFMRFPGGCIVEGTLPKNEYNWKDTVGALYERKSNYNLWSEKLDDGGYNQSYQIGFYEYFCLCEDLGMKPLPTLSAGLNCQIRSMMRGEAECPNIGLNSQEFQDYIVSNYMDLIEFANGDPATSEWAALRAKMGHPAPFGLERIGVGNENYDRQYLDRFEVIEKAIHAKYPDMILIMCGGLHPYYEEAMGMPSLTSYYEEVKNKGYKNVIIDEHTYHVPDWFENQVNRFDNYDRNGAGVYYGEYAANGLLGDTERAAAQGEIDAEKLSGETGDVQESCMRPMNESNQLDTALGEAAFLTGLEKNSDIVKMSSYAPLFNLIDSDQWNHNLINFNPKTLCLSTNYYVQQMFGCNLGNWYLPYEGELPEHVFVSATETDDTIYVKLVNTSGEGHSLVLTFADNVVYETVESLQSDNPGVRNNLEFAGEAEYEIQPQVIAVNTKDNQAEVEVKPYSVSVLVLKK